MRASDRHCACRHVRAAMSADDSGRLLTIDHFVRVKSTVPAIAGQQAQVYVRERVLAGMVARGSTPADRVVLFVHGAGTPAEVAFDAPIGDYSWMAYLAHAGFDVFSVDMTGYGRSTRPAPMNDPCNLAPNQRTLFTAAPCTPSYPHALTNIGSDWNDVGAAVDYIRLLRRVDRVSLVAWSLGGPRAGGYAAQNPSKVNRLVMLAPAYNKNSPAEAPKLPADGVTFNTQSRAEFDANWDRQVGCPGAVRPRGQRRGLVVDDRIGRRRRDVGTGRPARAADDDVGLESGDRRQDDDADADGGGHSRQAGDARARPRAVCRPRRPAEDAHRSRVLVAQRDVGEESSRALPRLPRVARQGDGERRQRRRAATGLLIAVIVKGSEVRRADHPIDDLFVDRWSPRAMSGEPIDEADLFVLFEAARWAPSAGNTHPWRILYARRDTEQWPLFFDLLVERNKVWCVRASALLLFISRTTNEQTGKPLVTHTYDTGAAWENLALQGTMRGLVVHGMAGFDYARARVALDFPTTSLSRPWPPSACRGEK